MKVEADGDLYLALHDAAGNEPGIVICEIPAKPQWCEIRNKVFGWDANAIFFAPSLNKETHAE